MVADPAGEPLGSAHGRVDAQREFRKPDPRGFRGDDRVEGATEFRAGADGKSVDPGHGVDGAGVDHLEEAVGTGYEVGDAVSRSASIQRRMRSRSTPAMNAGPSLSSTIARARSHGLLPRFGEFVDHLRVERVEAWGRTMRRVRDLAVDVPLHAPFRERAPGLKVAAQRRGQVRPSRFDARIFEQGVTLGGIEGVQRVEGVGAVRPAMGEEQVEVFGADAALLDQMPEKHGQARRIVLEPPDTVQDRLLSGPEPDRLETAVARELPRRRREFAWGRFRGAELHDVAGGIFQEEPDLFRRCGCAMEQEPRAGAIVVVAQHEIAVGTGEALEQRLPGRVVGEVEAQRHGSGPGEGFARCVGAANIGPSSLPAHRRSSCRHRSQRCIRISSAVTAATWPTGWRSSSPRSRSAPVLAGFGPARFATHCPPARPSAAESMEQILEDFREIMVPGLTHWNHPGFHAWFANTGSGPGILAETLTAALNNNAMVWRSGPAATELEAVVCDWLRQMVGLPEGFEGHIEDTASLTSITALAAARHRATGGESATRACARCPPMRVYCSARGAHVDRPGRDPARPRAGGMPQDRGRRRVPHAARKRSSGQSPKIGPTGIIPMAVVATVGTTSTTSIDPVDAIAEITQREKIWLHVDAAYGGSMAVSEHHRDVLEGAGRAESIVINPHKWLFVPMDCSVLLLLRHAGDPRDAFAGAALPDDARRQASPGISWTTVLRWAGDSAR